MNTYSSDGENDEVGTGSEEIYYTDYEWERMEYDNQCADQIFEIIDYLEHNLYLYPEELWQRCRPSLHHWQQYLEEGRTDIDDFLWRLPWSTLDDILPLEIAEILKKQSYLNEERRNID